MNDYNRPSSCLAGCVALCIVLIMGITIGGTVTYFITDGIILDEPLVQPVVNKAAPQPVVSVAPAINTQPLVITEQSASVDAVSKTLPAVVTVINQSGFGAGSGSGFFINNDGYLVTNNHVVEGGREINVIYAQGGIVTARLIGTAPEFDLAVLKVDGLVPGVIEWGDSSELPLGAQVIAIGSALGRYQNTVTSGILSGFNRELGGLKGLLQTDAAINHGNSGGPLINLAGQVVGINTMVVQGGPSEAVGLGFAIPSNIARNVVQRLIERGDVRPPFMGIQYQPLHPQLAAELRLSVTEGAYVEVVLENTPASAAGLQPGDVILKIADKQVDDRHPLVSLLFEHAAGDTITIELLRNGSIVQTQLTLTERA